LFRRSYEKIVVPADAREAGGEPGPITKDRGYFAGTTGAEQSYLTISNSLRLGLFTATHCKL